MRQDRLAAACGIAGPAAFVGAWAVGSAVRRGYDPLQDTISHLAEDGASTRPLMTAGFVAFGVLVPVWARTLGDRLSSRALGAVVATAGIATLGVAAFPVTPSGGTTRNTLHAVAAGTGYLAMAATPALAVHPLLRRGSRRAAVASAAVSAVSFASLVASLLVGDGVRVGSGGYQRLGLTVVDGWHVVAAMGVLRGGLRR